MGAVALSKGGMEEAGTILTEFLGRDYSQKLESRGERLGGRNQRLEDGNDGA